MIIMIMMMIMCNWDSIHSHKNRNWFSGTYKVLSECISLVVGTCLLLTTYYYILELLILRVLWEEQAKKKFSSSLWLLTAFLTAIPILGSFALREMQMLALNPPFCTLGFRTGRQCTMQVNLAYHTRHTPDRIIVWRFFARVAVEKTTFFSMFCFGIKYTNKHFLFRFNTPANTSKINFLVFVNNKHKIKNFLLNKNILFLPL